MSAAVNALAGGLVAATLLLSTTGAFATPPPGGVVRACLTGMAQRDVGIRPLRTSSVSINEDAGGRKVYSFVDGADAFGYVEDGGSDALVINGKMIPLSSATAIDKGVDELPGFSPMLADWSYVRDRRGRYVCVNFNLDGLGRSGRFQNVHGLYIVAPAGSAASAAGGERLYYVLRDVRKP